MKNITKTLHQRIKNNLFPALVTLALGSAVAVSPLAMAQENMSKAPQVAAEQVITLVNINQASIEDLMSLKGIGEKKAAAIVEYRNNHGSFADIDELTEVKGIGEAILNKNRELISL
ncbi:ComEA family DNA-binding protein [Agarilytica rhodophyticola]|uniref:ComEA family DNA-binding protein n=1 Tax=Agarilytica rhodophyticola TaxID=1737490 RepID=UPI001FE56F13|nr:ComEA family DNA-binding protein [Agarilytica rhodophyticola]